MAGMDLAALTDPVSADEPSGPDLDLEGDPDYLNFMARAEGLLPASFFSRSDGKPFDRTSIDFAAEFEAAKPLLERTRDIRLITLLTRFQILNRDLSGFVTGVEAIVKLLDESWEDVHPRAEGGDYMLRMTAIETLDDSPTVILPMQFLPLALHRRHGQINFRAYMIAVGEVRPQEDVEESLDVPGIERALMEVDLPPLVETLRQFDALKALLARVREVWIDRAGFEQPANLEKSGELAGRIIGLLNGIVVKRDPSLAVTAPEAAAAAEQGEGEAKIATGPITSRIEVSQALAGAADYFARREPSNPALLLVRQAEQLVGRSFVDAMRLLVPNFFDQAFIAIGGTHVFDLPIERLSALIEGDAAPQEENSDASGEETVDESLPSDYADFITEDAEAAEAEEKPEAADETSEEAGDGEVVEETASEETASEEVASEEAASEDAAGDEAVTQTVAPVARPAGVPTVNTRQHAFTLLDQVSGYYRLVEPTSPIPVIIEQARRLAERDFMYLLREVLPDQTLRSTVPPAPPES
jgi:type VI secretion system protein ImpA